MRIPSVGLTEVIIIAVVAGLALLAGGLVLAIVVRKQRGRNNQAVDHPGPGTTTPRSSNPGKWLLLLGLVAVLVLPLVVIFGGILIVTPVSSTRTEYQGSAPEVQVMEVSTPAGTSLAATPDDRTRPTSEPGAGSVEAPPPAPASLSIDLDDDLIFLILPAIAALALLLGVVIVAVILTHWRGSETSQGKGSKWEIALITFAVLAALGIFIILALDFSLWFFGWSVVIFAAALILVGLLLLVPRLLRRRRGEGTQPRDLGMGYDNGDEWARTARLRYALLALAIWFALSIFLILDVGFAVSVYLQFVAIYAAFCVLIGALLLVGSPRREKLLILGLLFVALFSIRFVNWNSRKPFLKDFYRVQEGMTVEQVEQIMGSYMGGICQPSHPLGLPDEELTIETEEMAQPDRAVYRHTDEGWGNSDWGEVHFEQGRVVKIEFLPD
jgi:hypothetical protein